MKPDPRTITTQQLSTGSVKLIGRTQLLAKIPLSDRTIFEMERRGEFPQRIVLSKVKVAWVEGEIDAWISSRVRSRLAQPA